MPKSKPTQVILHRIELQETERELLEALVATKSISNIVSPVLNNVAPIGLAYIAYQVHKEASTSIPNMIDRTSTVLANFLQPSYNYILKKSNDYYKRKENEQADAGSWWESLVI